MARFLCFRLHGPMASWGDVAVGERRPTSPHPSRSAILGLVAATLGVRRQDGETLQSLENATGFASRTDAPGEWVLDYHTAQGPEEGFLRAEQRAARKASRTWHRPATRRAETSYPRADLATVLSQREYRVDGLWTIAIWIRDGADARWTLEGLSAALERPRFVPYLGRKSCPLDVPMEPQVVSAEDPVRAMAAASFRSDSVLVPMRRGRQPEVSVRWEGAWAGLKPEQTSRRRDRVLVRSRWQFTERLEHEAAWTDPQGGAHAPEQD